MAQKLNSSSNSPLIPPSEEEDRSSWLRLFRSRGVGVQTFFRLLCEHGTATRVLDVLPDLAARAGVSRYAAATPDSVAAELRAGRKLGAQLLCFGDPDYPELLAEIPDPPPVLWTLGRRELLVQPHIALVGARNASGLGERMARQLARSLGESGFTTVSGLARGIDTTVHTASLETGTIAVLGGGIDVIYPMENAKLYQKIASDGLLISEQPIGLAPQARHFPRRNRIISGLSHALIVVEAAAKSGSLITARNAADQGRDVLAVPGHPFDARATGCNMLIRDGATLVRSAADVLEAVGALDGETGSDAALPPDAPTPDKTTRAGQGLRRLAKITRQVTRMPPPSVARDAQGPPSEIIPKSAGKAADTSDYCGQTDPAGPATRDPAAAILAHLGASPLPEDQLIRDLRLPATIVAPTLTELELDGRIARHAGGMVSLS